MRTTIISLALGLAMLAPAGALAANPAKTCKAERAADPAAFTAKYGTGKKGKNALGKCISKAAKA